MPAEFEIGARLPDLVEGLAASYRSDPRTHHIDRRFLPSRQEIIEIVQLLLELVYPGYYGRQDLTSHNVSYHVGELLPKLGQQLAYVIAYVVAGQILSSIVAGIDQLQ